MAEAPPAPVKEREHAIVLGASIAGLAAARVLSSRFARVTVIERDTLPAGAAWRRGTPHASHAHGLLASGREALERLFPGFTREIVEAGAPTGDLLGDCIWFNHGVYLKQIPTGNMGLLASRPLLESRLRARVAALPNVHILERCEATGLEFEAREGRVTGVFCHGPTGKAAPERLRANLVIDATGRSSRSPEWLAALGYAAPKVDEIEVGVTYTTRHYRREPHHARGAVAVIVRSGAPLFRFGVALAQENDSWIVTVGGYFGDRPALEEAEILKFAATLPAPELPAIMAHAEPLSPFRPFRFPASLRRQYEKLSRFPAGYLVMGDAFCAFNPSYGQGMSSALLQAEHLARCLAVGDTGLARRFFTGAARLIETPWRIATGSDLAHPKVEAPRPPPARFFNWYIPRLFRAAAHDGELAARFIEVANLAAPASLLLQPGTAWRVFRAGLRGSRLNQGRRVPMAAE